MATRKQQTAGPLEATDQLSEWMAAAQRGDQEAYESLLGTIQRMLYRYVRRRLYSDEAAEDVCQDILLTIHRVRHTYEPGRPFEPWLYSIAKSRLIDHLRRQKRLSSLEVMMETLPDAPAGAVPAGTERILEVLEKLPRGQREAFAMLKLEGLSTREAAERAGVSVSALKVRAHRAYGAIKKALSGD